MTDQFSISVKYISYSLKGIEYSTGLYDVVDLDDIYACTRLRGRVVAKIDVLSLLTNVFTYEIVKEVREFLMLVLKGEVREPNSLSNFILELYKADDVFRKYLRDTINKLDCDEVIIDGIIREIVGEMSRQYEEFDKYCTGINQYVICMSDGYMYYSFADSEFGPVLPFSEDIKSEVVSNVKNWKGNIRYERV